MTDTTKTFHKAIVESLSDIILPDDPWPAVVKKVLTAMEIIVRNEKDLTERDLRMVEAIMGQSLNHMRIDFEKGEMAQSMHSHDHEHMH